jgi:hypothetical protein
MAEMDPCLQEILHGNLGQVILLVVAVCSRLTAGDW